MAGPINYMMQGMNPTDAIMQGLQIGGQFAQNRQNQEANALLVEQRRQAIAQAQAKAQADAAAAAQTAAEEAKRQALVQRVSTPGYMPTQQDAIEAATLFGAEAAKNVASALNGLTKEGKASKVRDVQQVATAAMTNPQIAVDKLKELETAARNAKDEKGADEYAYYADLVTKNPAAAVVTLTGLLQSVDPDAVKVVFERTGEGRAAELQPGKVAEQDFKAAEAGAKARTAEAEADVAKDKYLADLRKAQSAADVEAVKAKYAERDAIDQGKKNAADLGLTAAQTAKMIADAKLVGANIAKIAAEQSQLGTLTPEKKVEQEGKLRKEYSDQTKVFQDTFDAYSRIQATDDTAAGDLSLIFGYMKMLDPGSTVREGEFATAQSAAGVPDRIVGLYNRVMEGERLAPSQRNDFKSQAKSLYAAAQKKEKTVRDGITRIAKDGGLKVDNIFYETKGVTEPTPAAPSGATAPTSGPVFKGWVK